MICAACRLDNPAGNRFLRLSTALRLEAGPDAAERIEAALATADHLIAETGARNLVPALQIARALLGAAQAGFLEMGATGRAREVARALAA